MPAEESGTPWQNQHVVVVAGGDPVGPHGAVTPAGAPVVAADSGVDRRHGARPAGRRGHRRPRLGRAGRPRRAIAPGPGHAPPRGQGRHRPRARPRGGALRRTEPRRGSSSSAVTAAGSTTSWPGSSRSPIPARACPHPRLLAARDHHRPARPGEPARRHPGELVTLVPVGGPAVGCAPAGCGTRCRRGPRPRRHPRGQQHSPSRGTVALAAGPARRPPRCLGTHLAQLAPVTEGTLTPHRAPVASGRRPGHRPGRAGRVRGNDDDGATAHGRDR